MCINKSTASGLQVSGTFLHPKHSKTPGPEPITTAICFAYLKSLTVPTIENILQSKRKRTGTALPSKSYSTILDAALVGHSQRGQGNIVEEDEATALQSKILKTPWEGPWQQSRCDAAVLLLSEGKRHMTNPCQCCTEPAWDRDQQGDGSRAVLTACCAHPPALTLQCSAHAQHTTHMQLWSSGWLLLWSITLALAPGSWAAH